MAERCKYDISLTLVSPFLFESIVNTRVGVDSAQIRDEVGRAIIPATHIKGVLRDVLETLAEHTELITEPEIRKLFGVPSPQDDNDPNKPIRGMAIFSDLAHDIQTDEPNNSNVKSSTPRIEIDDQTGAVKTGSLQFIELVAPLGKKVPFSGRLIIRYPEGLDRKRCEVAIEKALRLIPAMGALKSAGFGIVDPKGCSLKRTSITPLALSQRETGGRIVYHVTFDRPVLVSARHITENLFKSEKIIPGAVFKGALADRLMLAGLQPESNPDWAEPLTQLRISHAFPLTTVEKEEVEEMEAELPVPASIVYRKKDDGSVFFADAIIGSTGEAPLWKDEAAQFVSGAKKKFRESWQKEAKTPNWQVDLLSRTHVAVNEDGSGSGVHRIGLADRSYTAAESLLYTTVMLPVDGHKWKLIVDTGAINDQEKADRLIAALEDGLDGIGKTGAHATFTRINEPAIPELPKSDMIDIMLKTPAVLFDPVPKLNMSAEEHNSDCFYNMIEMYTEYFRELFNAKLKNLFARQKMFGGYHAMRRKPYTGYYPFVLTEAGAVFRLEMTGASSRQKVEHALRFGLPVPDLGGKAANWSNCPFMPENGYGEIVLHNPPGLANGELSFVKEAGHSHVW